MKRLLEKACIWFLTRHREYSVYKNREPATCVQAAVSVHIPDFIRRKDARETEQH